MKTLVVRRAWRCRAALVILTLAVVWLSPLLAQAPETRARRVVRARTVAAKTKAPKPKPPMITVADIKEAKERLTTLGYWLMKSEDSYRHALTAFQKVQALPPTGKLSLEDLETLRAAHPPVPKEVQTLEAGKIRVEIDLRRQVLFVIDHESNVTKILPISSGNGKEFTSEGFERDAITPPGRFNVNNKIKGWRKSPLGMLYYPNYFLAGLAIHGSTFVPAYPDSHGCIRIPMYAAEEFYHLLPMGTEVLIYGQPEVKE
ncbi:MAG: L,D-transpeptidase family protein [Blastocatellia bacterium]